MSATVEDAASSKDEAESSTPGSADADPEAAVARKRSRRYPSLDAARGLMLISSLATVSMLPPRGYQWDHSPWLGVRLYDLIVLSSSPCPESGWPSRTRTRRNWSLM